MKYEPIFTWSEETQTAICVISDGKDAYYGAAYCHPDDIDMMSEKTGCEIAFRRAHIKAYKAQRNKLKERLAALNQLYYSINRSKKFNEKSYENKMLQRQIHLINSDLTTIKELIATEEQSLRELIEKKDNFYKLVRKRRQSNKEAKH